LEAQLSAYDQPGIKYACANVCVNGGTAPGIITTHGKHIYDFRRTAHSTAWMQLT
jgi:hypothetical protein